MSDLLIADDHTIVRKGLLAMCNHTFKLFNVDEAEDLSSVMAKLKRRKYTHLVIDMLFSDGSTMEILANIRSIYPNQLWRNWGLHIGSPKKRKRKIQLRSLGLFFKTPKASGLYLLSPTFQTMHLLQEKQR